MTATAPEPPDQTGRRIIVTGASRGIGFFTAARLAAAGATVVLSGRDAGRVDAAARAIRARHPAAALEPHLMDISSLASVRAGAERLASTPVDGLIANAGIVHTPARRQTSPDVNELVLATNLIGHALFIARLLPALADSLGAAPARVVSLGSLSSRLSTFRVGDLQLEHGYDAWRAYAQSKIAVQAFAFELDRRLRAAGVPVASLVAHPGYSISGRTPRVPGVNEPGRADRFADALQAPIAQGKDVGALPVVHAATAAGVRGGDFWGPRFLTRGTPQRQRPTRTSASPETGARVWGFLDGVLGGELRLP
ncbi:SDR family NAD(P)-dependent oxidoreductase [Agromyces archimandritae]|uniref:SDR family NAD(P)-dependent oxidoreductase n=1 Tax=Agromyces archimandritae TaxID=2781962 RepID=A0A975FQG5_9MICO|nr:SDR family NAD(P)-dependent oxidoreductase [Agromyces archimandritae]QTX05833.1 SDR family NAD(P)-dependent oxidoreductase [Agromyces archimandritae]